MQTLADRSVWFLNNCHFYVGLLAALYMDGIQLKILNGETDVNFEALVFTDASFNRKGSLRYVPAYLVMFLEKEALPETMIYELPTL